MSIERSDRPADGPTKIINPDGSSVTITHHDGAVTSTVILDPDGPIPYHAQIFGLRYAAPPCAREAMDEFQARWGKYLPDERRVVLGGPNDRPTVNGKIKPRLTRPRYNVVKALLEAGENGLSKAELIEKSDHGDAARVLKRLAKSDLDWQSVIQLAGKAWRCYRILR